MVTHLQKGYWSEYDRRLPHGEEYLELLKRLAKASEKDEMTLSVLVKHLVYELDQTFGEGWVLRTGSFERASGRGRTCAQKLLNGS